MTILWIFVSNRFRTEFSVCSLHTVQFVVAQSKNLDLSAAIFKKLKIQIWALSKKQMEATLYHKLSQCERSELYTFALISNNFQQSWESPPSLP